MKELLTTQQQTTLEETYTLNTYLYEGTMYYEYMLDGKQWLYTTMPCTEEQLTKLLCTKYKGKYKDLLEQLQQSTPKQTTTKSTGKPKTQSNNMKSSGSYTNSTWCDDYCSNNSWQTYYGDTTK